MTILRRSASFLGVGTLLACAPLRTLPAPNILSTAPYNRVQYVIDAFPSMKPLATVSVTGRGDEATIRVTIPRLYQEALDKAAANPATVGKLLFITNIRVEPFTKQELYSVSYQDCHTETYTENVSQNSCTGYGASYHCSTTLTPQTRTRQQCETKWRQEMRTVLYQTASADALFGDHVCTTDESGRWHC